MIRPSVRVVLLMSLLAGLLAGLVSWNREIIAAPPGDGGFVPFSHWPKQKPDLVLVLSGQTFGYLSPCGCSRPQRGGLERRANFMDELRARGWPVVGLDLGDIAPPKSVPEQDQLKYRTAMTALRTMGYAATGLGMYDFDQQLYELLSVYTVQEDEKGDTRPIILAANLQGRGEMKKGPDGKEVLVVPTRAEIFPSKVRPWVDDVEVITKDSNNAACPTIGVTAVLGRTLNEKVAKLDPQFSFEDNTPALKAALAKMGQKNPAFRVLLYGGLMEEAEKVAAAFPEFNLIVCQSEESEPPQFPKVLNNNKTFIVQVGHKGQNVGALGLFRNGNSYDMQYQLVPLGEQYLTPQGQEGEQKILKLMEGYALAVKDRDLLAKHFAKQGMHANQINFPAEKLTYVGVDKCKSCHPNEGKIWGDSKHSHAYEALEKLAVNPRNRQFDGDCVSCHTTGFAYKTGFQNEKATPHLKHNGCENCHGPGSGHSAKPDDTKLQAAMVPWRTEKGDKMPAKATLEALAKVQPGQPATVQLTPREQIVINGVRTMCMRCHDGENDPKFDINVNFPKIWHSGFKAVAAAGLPANAK